MKFCRLALVALMSLAMSLPGLAVKAADTATMSTDKKPNVVFILADNVGYGDLGSYGGGELRGAPTPRLDQMAREGLRLTQYLVEPACTPSRAALMTGQYSIRNGLSLVVIPGSASNTLSAHAFTMGDMFHELGYATATFGKWHLGRDPQSLPTAHGFDEYYGIPPDLSWDSASYVGSMAMTHSFDDAPYQALLAKGPQVVEATLGGPLHSVKPYTMAVRAEIDDELTAKSIAFMKRQHAAGKPFFLYFPFSMGHVPNLPSKQFAGKSRIGNYGDKMMEGDYHVGQILDTIKELGIDDDTIVIFASDNGPTGTDFSAYGNQGTVDEGSNGPFRGALGESSEGSIRTCAIIRWPGHVKPDTTSYAMFSIMDFLPTLASIVGGKMPTDRPIDGVDQSDVVFGRSAMGHRETMLTFIGWQLVAIRWEQWRVYLTDMEPTGLGPQRMMGTQAVNGVMAGYPKEYNIEMDPHEDDNVAGMYPWVLINALGAVRAYEGSVQKYPNPPAPNVTIFGNPSG